MAIREGDYMEEIVSYIENNIKKGYRKDQLRFLLINQGYSRSAIDRALKMVDQRAPQEPENRPEQPRKIEFLNDIETPKKESLFSKLKDFFTGKSKKMEAASKSDKVAVDSQGNLVY